MRYLVILLFLTGCAAVPKEEKPELQEYIKKRGDVIWYCESRGGPKRCGWVERKDLERSLKAIYRW